MSSKVHSSADVEIAPAKMSSAPPEPNPAATIISNQSEAAAEFVKCDCCGLTEECTPTYIAAIRGRYGGRWICGLCAEAVKDEIARSGRRPITTEEALDRHRSFSKSFRSSTKPPPNPKEHLISAMRQLLRRSLDKPRATRPTRSTPSSPRKGAEGEDDQKDCTRGGLARSGSCISTIGG